MESAPEKNEASKSCLTAATPSISPLVSTEKRTHPKISTMVKKAIRVLKSRGDSLSEIKQYIALVYKVDTEKLEPAIANYLKQAVASGYFKKSKKPKCPGAAKVLNLQHEAKAGSSQMIMNLNNTCDQVNTELAKAYFKKNNHQFPNKPEKDEDESDKDGYMNTIFYEEHPAESSHQCLRKLDTTFITVLEGKIRKLVDVIKKNTETFCQIEFLVRKIPMEEVREYDMKLIVQYLQCFTIERIRWEFNDVYGDRIYMDAGTPLANLGYVAQLLVRNKDDVVIVSTKNTAAVCQFFVDLCHSVGLDLVQTVCVKSFENVDITINNMEVVPALSTGCIGVVTERCDVAAAAGAFLRSTTRYPWKLSWIFVHESVFDEFNRAMVQQCPDKRGPVPAGLRAAAKCCKSAFQCDGKTFLADFAGDARSAAGAVLVNTYRSADEVVACVNVHRARYLSLWTDDASRAHAVALAVAASLVWVNCYAVFDGPPQASLAIYTEMTLAGGCSTMDPIMCSRESLLKKQENWARLPFEDRQRTVLKITDDLFYKFGRSDRISVSERNLIRENLKRALGEVRPNDHFRVDGNRTCAVLPVPVKVIYRSSADIDDMLRGFNTMSGAKEMARLLTNGSALIFQQSNDLFDYFSLLATKLPITWNPRDHTDKPLGRVEAYYSAINRTKVIWTKFGK